MKPGGLKLLERSPCKLTSRYKADVSRQCERISKWNITYIQSIFGRSPAAGKAEGMVTVTPPAQRALALIYRHCSVPTHSCGRSVLPPLQDAHPANSPGKEQGVIFNPPLLVVEKHVIGEGQRVTLKEVSAPGSIPL